MLFTHLLPAHFSSEQLRGHVAVMIDILRASATITTAIANGAERVIPCEQVEQAFQLREQMTSTETILGGERSGVLIEGFDYGNSPADYSAENVAGKTVLFTTTNGTRAIHRCREADSVFIGSFLNLCAVTEKLSQCGKSIHLVCAGTDGAITLEDCLYAGAVAKGLIEHGNSLSQEYDDTTRLCVALYDQSVSDEWEEKSSQILAAFKNSQGGRNLLRLGMQADLSLCSQLDTLDVIASWDRETNRINALPVDG